MVRIRSSVEAFFGSLDGRNAARANAARAAELGIAMVNANATETEAAVA